ncbi:3-alpha,7-alpha,12-alpha-trihydroxy-5-beta-cholest-24-enoyl-CoA hydratase, partial [Nocardia cyriacigeorgica]
MPIDPKIALGAELPSREFAWTASDVQLYQLGLGAGARWTDAAELRYLDDRAPQVLPTFATVAQTLHETEPPKVSFPGIDIDLAKVVHGSQEIVVHRPIPASGKATSTGRISEIWDKGSAAVVVQENTITGSDGAPLWTARSSIFAKGEGGFGGERGPSTKSELPDRAPDFDVTTPTLPQQALLYRMLG